MKKEFEKLLSKTPDEWRPEYMADLEFTFYDLDEAVATHAQRFMNWANLERLASKYYKMKQEEYDRAKAKLDLAIRRDPVKYKLDTDDKIKRGKEPPKETAIKSRIAIDKGVIAKWDDMLEAYQYNKIMKHAVEAFKDRKTMIREAGDLWINEYHSDVDVRDAAKRKTRKNIGKGRVK